MLKNGFYLLIRILVSYYLQLWWWTMLMAISHTIPFQLGDFTIIGHFPVGQSVQPESIGTNSFVNGKCPAQRWLILSGIKVCQV